MKSRKSQLIIIFAVFALVVGLDQISKAYIRAAVPLSLNPFAGRDKVFFFISHQENPGLVNGLFRDHPVLAKTMPLLASLVLIYLYKHLDPRSRTQALAYGLVAGGAVGNLIDRLWFGVVTDFIQVHFYFIPFNFPWKRYPAFNLADSAICVGVALLILSWRSRQPKEEPRVSDPA